MRIVMAGVVAVVASVMLLVSRPVAADSSTSLTGEWTNGKNTIAIRTTKALPDDPQATLAVTDVVGNWVETGTTPMVKTLGLHKGTMRGEKDRFEGSASTHTFLIFWIEGAQLHVRSDGLNKFTSKMETFSTIVFKKMALTGGGRDTSKADNAPAKADVDKFLAFFDELVDVVVANKDACPKMATEVNKLINANQDLLKMGAEAKAKGLQLPKEAQDHMMASTKTMMGAMQKCGNDSDVQRAFQRLDVSKKR